MARRRTRREPTAQLARRGGPDPPETLGEGRAIRTIDCTALGPRGEIPVSEDERDSVLAGGIEILGGYLDWDASRILRIPSQGMG